MWQIVAITALLSALLSLAWGRLRLRAASGGSEAGTGLGSRDRYGWAFLLCCVLLYLNQVAFQVYVLEEHGGRLDFLERRFPAIFFHLAPEHLPVVWLRGWLGDVGWLSPSVLRVQAVLELPFALLAYLSVAHLLDRGVARQIAGGPLGVLACLSYTVVLMAIEVLLWNPYTEDDLVLRVLACGGTIALLRGLAGPPVAREAPSAVRLVLFFLGLAAMSVLVVIVNVVALLYNLAWLWPLLPLVVCCALLYGSVSWLSRRPMVPSGSWLVGVLSAVGRRFALLFCVPALAIRYGVTSAESAGASVAALLLILLASVVSGIWAASQEVARAERLAWGLRVLGGLLGAGATVQLDLARWLAQPALDAWDGWFVQKGALLLLGFGLAWGGVALVLGGLGWVRRAVGLGERRLG